MNRDDRPSIIIALPLVWGVRNVVQSGLMERLEREFRVILAIPEEGRGGLLAAGIPERNLWVLEKPVNDRFHEWALRLLKQAHSRRRPTASDEVFRRRRAQRSLRELIRDAVFGSLGQAATHPQIFGRLERLERILFARRMPRSLSQLLRETTPVLGLSTSCVMDWERPLLELMRKARIPTATHILSFDNLTSRGYLPLHGFDHFFVWQGEMAAELRTHYAVPGSRITVTGTPQFDFHVHPRFRRSRVQTADELGIDPARPYVLYCANHFRLTPYEPELLDSILTEAVTSPGLSQCQWVLRLHPMDQYRRWEQFCRRHPQVALSLPWSHDDDQSHWGTPDVQEIARLGNTLRHAAVTLTVASTAALDSAVVGTPAVCVGFHPRGGSAEDRFYRDLHRSHHYQPISDSGAVPVAADMNQLLLHLTAALEDRGGLAPARAALVKRICGLVDGNATQRLGDAVIELARRSRADRERFQEPTQVRAVPTPLTA